MLVDMKPKGLVTVNLRDVSNPPFSVFLHPGRAPSHLRDTTPCLCAFSVDFLTPPFQIPAFSTPVLSGYQLP